MLRPMLTFPRPGRGSHAAAPRPPRLPLRLPLPSLMPLLLVVLLLSSLLAPATPAGAAEGPWRENDQSRVRLVSAWERAPHPGAVGDGEELRLGLEFEIIPGWHVYWINSGDAGFPPALDLSPTPGVASSEILYPAPERYDLRGGLVAFGYEDHVIYPVSVELERDGTGSLPAGAERWTLTGELDYLVCEVDCIPYSYTLTLEQPLAAAGGEPVPSPAAGEVESWWERLPRPVEELAGVRSEGRLDLTNPDAPRLVVELEGVRAAGGEGADARPELSPELFLEPQETFDVGRPQVETLDGGLRFEVPLSFLRIPEELPREAPFAWTVTGLAPADGTTPTGSGDTLAVTARRTVPVVGTAASPGGAARDRAAGAGAVEGEAGTAVELSWLWQAGLDGVVLALTPALLALLGLFLLRLRGLAGGGVRRGALATAGGSVVGMWLLAAAGRAVDLPTWGAQLQSPVLVTLLILATVALALACWRLLESGALEPGAAEDTIARTRPEIEGLGVGLAAALLALSWNAPHLGEVVGPALDAGPVPTLLVATSLGLGLALPWLLVAAAPALATPLRRLEDGARRLREGLGFLALLGLLWLLYLLHGLVSQEGLALIELALVALGLLAWARKATSRRALSWILGLLLLATAGYVLHLAAENRRVRTAGTGAGVPARIAAAAIPMPAGAPKAEARRLDQQRQP